MLICYALEDRSPWFILAFAIACALGSAYGFLQGAWPFGLVEGIWSLVAVRRWRLAKFKLRNYPRALTFPRPELYLPNYVRPLHLFSP
jgi:hypothetical protein